METVCGLHNTAKALPQRCWLDLEDTGAAAGRSTDLAHGGRVREDGEEEL